MTTLPTFHHGPNTLPRSLRFARPNVACLAIAPEKVDRCGRLPAGCLQIFVGLVPPACESTRNPAVGPRRHSEEWQEASLYRGKRPALLPHGLCSDYFTNTFPVRGGASPENFYHALPPWPQGLIYQTHPSSISPAFILIVQALLSHQHRHLCCLSLAHCRYVLGCLACPGPVSHLPASRARRWPPVSRRRRVETMAKARRDTLVSLHVAHAA